MTPDQISHLIDYLIGGGAIAFLTWLLATWKTRHEVRRDDRSAQTDDTSKFARASGDISQAAANVVKLQDNELVEAQKEIRALQAEVSAIRTVLQTETQARFESQATQRVQEKQISELRGALAEVKAQFFVQQDELKKVRRENDALRGGLFNMAVGIERLIRQVRSAGLEPDYTLEMPIIGDKSE